MILSFFALFMMLQSVSDAACYWAVTTWVRGPANVRSGFIRLSSQGSWDEVNDCGVCSHVVRGRSEADNSSVSDSIRPELGHNWFGLQWLSPHYPWLSDNVYLQNYACDERQQQKSQKYGYLRGGQVVPLYKQYNNIT